MTDTTETATPQEMANNSLLSQQFLLGCYAMTIVAGTVAAVFYRGNDAAINVALGFVFGSMGAGVIGFFFGSSKGSQSKDALRAAPITTTVTTPPATVTTTTGT